MAKLHAIQGIGEVYRSKLEALGLRTTDDLLTLASTPRGRKDLAEKTGVDAKRILQWVNCADLFRIKGIGPQYAELLEASGVDTVPELAQRRPENLYAKLGEVNQEKALVRQLPTLRLVRSWVAQAKALPRLVHY